MSTIIVDSKINPANAPQVKTPVERKRIPMSVPQLRLQVPEIPGYHQHWFLENRIPRALQGGYEFVDPAETDLNQLGVGADGASQPNADMGSQVRIVGGIGQDGRPEYLVLMKIKEEWWQEDQKALDKVNMNIIDSLRRRKIAKVDGERPEDEALRYVSTADMTTHTKTRRS